MNLIGVVILYHPDENVINNIKTYIHDLKMLYIMDNTEKTNALFKEKLNSILLGSNYKNYEYKSWQENKGISYNLNYALKKCKEDEFLLTMDQDSSFSKGMLWKYKKRIESFKDDRVAMYSVNYSGLNAERKGLLPYEVKLAITSGSVVNTTFANQLGGFDEKLFIDGVDSEFCYRSKKNGYKVIVFPEITMKHQVGNPNKHKFLWRTYNVYNHSPIRKYYIVRNCIYIIKKYPDQIPYCVFHTIKMIIKVLLAEQEKKKNFKYMYWGIKDAIKKNMGKFSHDL